MKVCIKITNADMNITNVYKNILKIHIILEMFQIIKIMHTNNKVTLLHFGIGVIPRGIMDYNHYYINIYFLCGICKKY